MDTPDAHDALFRQVDEHITAGDRGAAIQCLEDGLRQAPHNFSGWMRLGRLLYEDGRYGQAVKAVQACEQFDPLLAEFQSVQQHIQRGNLQGAEDAARAMLKTCPGHPRAVFTLAHVAQARGREEERVAVLRQGLQHGPANPVLRQLLVGALESAGAYGQAVEAAREVVALQETYETVWGLTSILLRYGQNEAALEMCARAERLCGGDAMKLSDVALVRGQVLRILGRRDDSLAAFRESLAHNPRNGASWWGLADTKTYRFTEADGAAISQLVADPGLDAHQRGLAAFALARQRESAGDIDGAMEANHRANALCDPGSFNGEGARAGGARLIQAMQGQALRAQARPDPGAPVPVFIVGLPRSGSTLVEQILASHSQIEGTMELPVLPGVKRRAHAVCQERFGSDYLSAIGRLPEADLSALGRDYLSQSAFFRDSETKLFTDKMPFNFEHVGLIHKILPHAVIIDARRNPLDCGLSIYKQHFTQGSTFSYDLGSIGTYYNLYLAIMDHWDRVLDGRVLRVQYEALVRSPGDEVRRLLEGVGVEFEEKCLQFHKTDRAVRTASSEQVRQPLYQGSIGAWRSYERHLGPLREALGEETINRFAALLE